jgi:hypothetical protein
MYIELFSLLATYSQLVFTVLTVELRVAEEKKALLATRNSSRKEGHKGVSTGNPSEPLFWTFGVMSLQKPIVHGPTPESKFGIFVGASTPRRQNFQIWTLTKYGG